jgi:4-nitrophenyl phosphatase
MCYAYHYIKRGAVFLATNVDSTLPSAGALFPGAGSITAPLVSMLGGQQPMSFGKPSQAMMDAIEGKFKFDRSKACMVGDRANTDIKFGLEGKLGGTLGVLTGVSSKTDFLEGDTRPAYYVDELGDLLGGA